MVRASRFLLLCLLAASCAAPPPRVDVPLTEQSFQSADGLLQGRVPKGWFVSTDNEIAPQLLAWLTREDYAATLAFQEIFLDRDAANRIGNKGLSLLAELSFRLKVAEEPGAIMASPPREFSLRGKNFCGYEYLPGVQRPPRGVVVFRIRDRCFESVALPSHDTFTPRELEVLFNTQQAVLASLSP